MINVHLGLILQINVRWEFGTTVETSDEQLCQDVKLHKCDKIKTLIDFVIRIISIVIIIESILLEDIFCHFCQLNESGTRSEDCIGIKNDMNLSWILNQASFLRQVTSDWNRGKSPIHWDQLTPLLLLLAFHKS